MTELTVKVLKRLNSIFPHLEDDLLLSIIDNSDCSKSATVDEVVVQSVEQILEGEEAANRRLKHQDERNHGKKKPSCSSITDLTTKYRDAVPVDQSGEGTSLSCYSDVSNAESLVDVSQSPKSSSSFGISSLSIDNWEGKRGKLFHGEGSRRERMNEWLDTCGEKIEETDEDSKQSEKTGCGVEEDELPDILELPDENASKPNQYSPPPSTESCSNSDLEIISLDSTADASQDSWPDSQLNLHETSLNKRCQKPPGCTTEEEDEPASSSPENFEVTEVSDSDTATLQASQETDDFPSESIEDAGSNPQNMDTNVQASSVVSQNCGDNPDEQVIDITDSPVKGRNVSNVFDIDVIDITDTPNKGCASDDDITDSSSGIDFDVSALVERNEMLTDCPNASVKDGKTLINVSDIVQLESQRQCASLGSGLAVGLSGEPAGSSAHDLLDLNCPDDLSDTRPVISLEGRESSIKVKPKKTVSFIVDSAPTECSKEATFQGKESPKRCSVTHRSLASPEPACSQSVGKLGRRDFLSNSASKYSKSGEEKLLAECTVTSTDTVRADTALRSSLSDSPVQIFDITSNSQDETCSRSGHSKSSASAVRSQVKGILKKGRSVSIDKHELKAQLRKLREKSTSSFHHLLTPNSDFHVNKAKSSKAKEEVEGPDDSKSHLSQFEPVQHRDSHTPVPLDRKHSSIKSAHEKKVSLGSPSDQRRDTVAMTTTSATIIRDSRPETSSTQMLSGETSSSVLNGLRNSHNGDKTSEPVEFAICASSSAYVWGGEEEEEELPPLPPKTKLGLLQRPQFAMLQSDSELDSELQQIVSIFPDVDVAWAKMELSRLKAQYPSEFLNQMCSTMADRGYKRVREGMAVEQGKGKGKGKHRSVNVKGSLEKIKTSQRYVDVLSVMGEEAKQVRRLGRKRPSEEAMDVNEIIPEKVPVVTYGTDFPPDIQQVDPVQHVDPTETAEDFDSDLSTDSVYRLQCECCSLLVSTTKLTQCCEGHLLCKSCVEKSVKAVLAQESKIAIICQVESCSSEIRLVDAKKVLPKFVVDLLQERLEKQERSSINKMSDIVSCPECGVSVVMEQSEKQFHCPNTDCMVACCRYCKKPWNDGPHHYCSPLISVPSQDTCTNFPPHWDPVPSEFYEDFMKFVVLPQSMEFAFINAHFKRCMFDYSITRLTRIQNPKLWQKYGLTRSHILEDFGPQKLNEKHLFHGTQREAIESICREGFDWRLCGQHGTAFGQGSYFASDASYSHRYAVDGRLGPHFKTMGRPNHSFILLVARVLCGRYTLGSHMMRRPPPDPTDPKQRPFNSVVNNVRNPSIYVTFDSSQTYPEYVIEYEPDKCGR